MKRQEALGKNGDISLEKGGVNQLIADIYDSNKIIDVLEDLDTWRSDRNINTPNTKVYVKNIIEELLEIFYSEKNTVKYLQEEIFDMFFDENPLDENSIVDAINDISVFSINENENMGYNFEDTMTETIKEISSREQDPAQKLKWQQVGNSGEKWQKNKLQSKSSLYTADYSICHRAEDESK